MDVQIVYSPAPGPGGAINYVNQATADGKFTIPGSPSQNKSYFFFSASILAASPEDTTAARVVQSTNDGSKCYYNSTTNELRFFVHSNGAGGTRLFQGDYPCDLSTEKHIAFKYDGINGTATFWVDGSSVTANTITTSPAVSSVADGVEGIFLFDASGGLDSIRATKLSQVVLSTSNLGISDVYSGGAPVYDISGLSAEVILGHTMTADENAGNTAQGWNDGYSLGSISSLTVTNSFADV